MSWVVFGLDVLIFYVVVLPCLHVSTLIIFAVLVGFVGTSVLYSAYTVTSIDPLDNNVKSGRSPSELVPDATQKAYCDLCGPVENRSKHCRACNKCVEEFDHHCKWLNNCVGKANYKYFILLIISVSLLSAMFIALSVYVLIEAILCLDNLNGSCGPELYWNSRYGGYHISIVVVFTSILIVVNAPLFILDLHLVGLHLYLMRNGLTTFEYITQRVEVLQPAEQSNDEKRFWGDWIIINRARLQRARDKFRRKNIELSQTAMVLDENNQTNDLEVDAAVEQGGGETA